ncbi:MAG: CheR family methyltransferase, partial [Bryobacteraceae bacterium]
FTYYKRNTVFRRTKRRMALQNIHDLKVYCFLVEQSNKEADALAQDLLVNVTSFFRDPEVYRAMREIIFPMFLEGRSREDPIRIWIPGCSTGEEAYSLAIELTEFLDQQSIQPVIQIFATDLSEAAIQKARAAVYLESSVTGISPERMRRFFVKRARVYQIAQPLRDICVFARQDVTRDPPFSKIDLISCCNLLIYLGPAAQRRALSVFHYALKSKGILVLGSSESVGPLPECFQAIDRESRIFARKGTSSKLKLEPYSRRSSVSVAVPDWVPGDITAAAISIRKEAERMLLAEYAPASVIVDESDRVIQVIGQTDRYLHIPQGAPTDYLTPMIKPGLVAGLKSAVVAARKQNTPVSVRRLHVKEGRRFRMVDVRVCRMPSQLRETGFLLISFQDSREPAVSSRDIKKPEESKSDRQVVERQEHEIVRLEQELIATRDYLQAIVETQETSAEELRSATEEAEANNEELQAAREELQASNEELNTLNDELRIRNTEQNSLNGDLRKLLETISVPLVMVGKDLRIRWFTHAMETLLNLSPNDQGKLITDLRMTLIPIPDFVQMLVRALAGSEETTAEFQQPNGRWFSLRILPYSDGSEAIEGVIATLIDIDDLKRARDFAEAVVQTVREPLIVLDTSLRVRTANDSFYKIFQVERHETEGRLFYEIGTGRWNLPKLKSLLEEYLPKHTELRDFEVEHHIKDSGVAKTMLMNAREIRQADGEGLILLAIDDITELRRSSEDLRRRNEDLKQFIYAASHDLREPLRMIVAHTQLLASRYADRLDVTGGVSIRYAVEGALRLETLISGLREFWELTERAREPSLLVDCGAVLRQVIMNLEAAISGNDAVITSDELPSVMGSEVAFIQLFQNLLSNALKYRSDVPPHIHVSALSEDSETIFCVRDNGIGIDFQHSRQIFGVFKRLHPPGRYPGTGIGLAICQKIVERYGGRIWVESQPGEGSVFKFALPA